MQTGARRATTIFAMLAGLMSPALVLADSGGLDTGDTAWILTATALVLFMTIPGLSLFSEKTGNTRWF